MFDKMSKETVRIRGSTQGKIDIIRGVNEIPDRQYLNDLYKINKQLNQRNVRPAFAESGSNIVLNNELPVETGALRQSVQHQRGPNILEQVTQPIPSTHNSDNYTIQTPKMARLLYSTGQHIDQNRDPLNDLNDQTQDSSSIFLTLAMVLPNDIIISLKQYGTKFVENILDGNKFQDVLLSMGNNLSEVSIKYLMELAQDFIENQLDEIHQILKTHISTESILYRILKYVLENYRNYNYEYLAQQSQKIIKALKDYFLSLNTRNPDARSIKCTNCIGTFSICS